MRIAVISDTHNRLPDALLMSIAEADEIWHLGDVCDLDVLLEVSALGPPVRVVAGNCDQCARWPLMLKFELEGARITLIHIPPKVAPTNTDLVLHGHTHVPRDEVIGGVRFLNPGPVTRPHRGAFPSFAWLELKRGTAVSWGLQRLPGRQESDD